MPDPTMPAHMTDVAFALVVKKCKTCTQIAEWMGVSRETVMRAIRELKMAGVGVRFSFPTNEYRCWLTYPQCIIRIDRYTRGNGHCQKVKYTEKAPTT